MRFVGHAITLAAAFGLLLSGCLGSTKPAQETEPVPVEWKRPEAPKIDAGVLLSDLSSFVKAYPHRAAESEQHKGARNAMADFLAKSNLTVWRHAYSEGSEGENICGYKLGAVENATWVVVGAHYDTTTWDAIGTGGAAPGRLVSEGAYDDGSGTQITLELARAFANVPSYYSILFCAFDGEELGLDGSRAMANALKTADETNPIVVDEVRAMLDFDMFGICWPTRAPINFDTNSAVIGKQVQAKREEMKIPDDMFSQGTLGGGSDFASFSKWPTVFYSSDMGQLAVPTPVPVEGAPPLPLTYPWWHWMDTMENMEHMAGGPELLRAGFQTAIDLSVFTLDVMANQEGKL